MIIKKSIAFICIALTILLVVILRLNALYQPDPVKPKSNDRACLLEDECLFIHALADKIIEPASPFLKLKPIDSIDPDDQSPQAKLLKRIHYSEPGKVIRRELQLWNNTRSLVAVRHHKDGTDRNLWRLYEEKSENSKSRYLRLVTQSDVPVTFGFVHRGKMRGGFGRWQAVAGINYPVMAEKSFVVQKPQNLDIQYIGRLVSASVRLNGGNHRIDPRQIIPACEPDIKYCSHANSQAGAIRVSAESMGAQAGKINITVRLHLKPVYNDDPLVDGLRIRYLNDENRYAWRALKPKAARKPNQHRFITADPNPVLLTNHKGEVNSCGENLGLVPMIGVNSGFAFSLNGLFSQATLPYDGFDIQLSIDARAQHYANQVLTEAMSREHGTPHDDDKKGVKTAPWYQKLQSSLEKDKDPQRRAALVILDADNGDILAAAGWPALPPLDAVTPWDLLAYHKVYEKHGHISPLEVQAWQNLNRDNTPGSIFKPVVATAAASRVSSANPFLREYLTGIAFNQWDRRMMDWDRKNGWLPPELMGQPRTSAGSITPVPGKQAIGNFKNQPLSGHFRNGKLGLREGILNSSNVYFIRLEMILDGLQARRYNAKQRGWRRDWQTASDEKKRTTVEKAWQQTPLYLVETMKRFGFGRRLSLANWKNFSNLTWPNERYTANTLSAVASGGNVINPDVMYREAVQWPLAQTAIGQAGIQVTPLHIATIIASISKNHLVEPNLFKRLGQKQSPKPAFGRLKIQPDILEIMHAGLKAVPMAGGTAAGAFHWARHPDTNLIYAKTGTAEIKLKQKNVVLQDTKSVWFVGWRAPKLAAAPATQPVASKPQSAPTPQPEQRSDSRTLAFACMVTHAGGTGGGTCAPIVAEFFRRMNRIEAPALDGCSRPPKVTPPQVTPKMKTAALSGTKALP